MGGALQNTTCERRTQWNPWSQSFVIARVDLGPMAARERIEPGDQNPIERPRSRHIEKLILTVNIAESRGERMRIEAGTLFCFSAAC
jgi:hypothetical protein